MPINENLSFKNLSARNRLTIVTILVLFICTAAISSFAANTSTRSTSAFNASNAQIEKGATINNGIISFNDANVTTTSTPNTSFEAFDRNTYWVPGSPAEDKKAQDPKTQGAFRTNCHPSHLAYVDPIAKFNQPGASHLHMFFGNRNTTFNSTEQSIKNTGMGTCDGGPMNRTAYWIPAMMQNQGSVVLPYHSVFYYKTEYNTFNNVQAMPDGLRMIAGDGMSSSLQTDDSKVRYKFKCSSLDETRVFYDNSFTIGNCPSSSILDFNFFFPQCWDGRLDSPDHKSHLAYIDWGATTCPASHPTLIPQVSLNMRWRTGNSSTANWYLSSDDMTSMGMGKMTGGTTVHADWFMGWDSEAKTTWHNNCLKKVLSCNAGQTGDGRTLKSVPLDYPGPYEVAVPASKNDVVRLPNSGLEPNR